MTTMVLIDENSGYVWGIAVADDPIEACRIVDAASGEHDRTYQDIGGERFNGRSGYHVHRAPDGFDCDDGQDEATIFQVTAMPLLTRVATGRSTEQ